MGTTADGWTVGGALSVAGASAFTGRSTHTGGGTFNGAADCYSTLYSSGLAQFHGNFQFGATGAYMTDGKYNVLFSDGDGVKFHAVKGWDIVTNAYAKIYVMNGTVVAMA